MRHVAVIIDGDMGVAHLTPETYTGAADVALAA
jgi:uncharacterized MnhB-related membrane protein